MRKILKTLWHFNLILLMVAPNVTSCLDEGVNLADVATNLNLGYLENFKKETIMNAFAKKNPKVDMNLVSFGGGNSYRQNIGVAPPFNRGYKQSNINFTSTSKLGFGSEKNNIFPMKFTKKNQKFTVPISILSDNYDEKVDGKILGSAFSDFNYDYQIDWTNKLYNVTITLNLKDKKEWFKDEIHSFILSWGDVYLVTVEALIDFSNIV